LHLAVDGVHGFLGGDLSEVVGDVLHFGGVVFGEVFGGDDGVGGFSVGVEVDDVEVAPAGGEEGAAALADGGSEVSLGVVHGRHGDKERRRSLIPYLNPG